MTANPRIHIGFSNAGAWWSGAITWATDGYWSHTFAILDIVDGTKYAIEAIEGAGVTESPMSKFRAQADDPSYRLSVVSLDPIAFQYGPSDIARAWAFAGQEEGKIAYSNAQLAQMLMFQSLLNVPVKGDSSQGVCSTLVARLLMAAVNYDCCDLRHQTVAEVSPDSLFRRLADRQGGMDQITCVGAAGLDAQSPLLADKWSV
jgi:hypothetical protein